MKNQTEKNTADIQKLKFPTFRQDIFHPSRLMYALIFSFLFTAIGIGFPYLFHQSTTPFPCDLADGTYFYRGIFTYHVKGVEKVAPFSSEQFTVATDSADITN